MRNRTLLLVLLAAVVWLRPGEARAQARAGLRAGVSADPSQFHVGGHVETAPLVERLSFRPNVEVGIGDDATALAMNLEFVYDFPLKKQPWRLYLGGGPAANVYWFDQGRRGCCDTSDVGGGFNLLVGFEHARGLFTELKVGAIDSPNFKFAVGYNVRR